MSSITYQWAKHKFSGNENLPQFIQYSGPFLASTISNLVYYTLGVVPEIVGQKMQDPTRPLAQRTARSVVAEIYAAEGVRGFFRGYGLMVGNGALSCGTIWLAYEHLKTSLAGRFGTFHLGSYEVDPAKMLAGSLADCLAICVSNPVDVVKVRLQMDTGNAQYRGAWDAFKRLWRAEGLRGLTRGLGPDLMTGSLMGAWAAFTYEFMLHLSVIPKAKDKS
eukprot:RCo046759